MNQPLAFYFFGSPRVEYEGASVEFDTRKAIALLAYLAATGRSHRRDSLAALLWPDYSQAKARAALRRTLSVLNKGLAGRGLLIQREEIGLQSQDVYVDLHEFEHLRAAGPAEERYPALAQAAAVYRADFLEGFGLRDSLEFDDWQYQAAERYRTGLAGILDELAELAALRAEYPQAIAYARRRLGLDNLHEEAHRRLMRLYAWSGQRSEALRQFTEFERLLKTELGVAPLEETVDLYQAILEGRLAPPQPAARARPVEAVPPVSPSAPPVLLVGREQALEDLQRAHQTRRGQGYFIGLWGEAGIGKTHLAEAFLAQVREGGGRTLSVRCYSGEETLAYSPLIEALRACLSLPGAKPCLQNLPAHWTAEAARLLPELLELLPGLPPVPDLDGPGAQSRFYEGLRQVLKALLCGGDLPVLFFDDLHWADSATLDWFAYLARRLDDFQVLVLAAWRGDGPAAASLHQLLASLVRSGRATEIALRRFSRPQVEELIEKSGVSLAAFPPDTITRLVAETEGLPFFVVEYLRAIQSSGQLAQPREWVMPASVRDLLHSRLSGVDDVALQLLTTAAVIGRSFDFDILCQASGRSEEETVAGLESLRLLGLVKENDTGTEDSLAEYDFTQDKMRVLVYEDSGLARRRLLHRRVADALEARPRSRRSAGQLASRIAYHAYQAGLDQRAAQHYLQAGHYARSVYANNEALDHYRAALELGSPRSGELHEAVGDLLTLSGDYAAALNHYHQAAAGVQGQDLLRLLYKQGDVNHRQGNWGAAEEFYLRALSLLGDPCQDPAAGARLYAAWSRTVHHRGESGRALDLASRSLELAGDDLPALIQAHNVLGMLARSQENYPLAARHLETSLNLAGTLGDLLSRAAALNNLALLAGDCEDWPQAIERVQAALTLCRQLGDRHREAALLNTLADFYYRLGQPDQAMTYLKQAVVIFAEIGESSLGLQPEIWKLTEW